MPFRTANSARFSHDNRLSIKFSYVLHSSIDLLSTIIYLSLEAKEVTETEQFLISEFLSFPFTRLNFFLFCSLFFFLVAYSKVIVSLFHSKFLSDIFSLSFQSFFHMGILSFYFLLFFISNSERITWVCVTTICDKQSLQLEREVFIITITFIVIITTIHNKTKTATTKCTPNSKFYPTSSIHQISSVLTALLAELRQSLHCSLMTFVYCPPL